MAADAVTDSGALLKKARQAANISEQEMAERLNMSLRYLKALERNDRKALPAVVFVRGYILSYARELHLDPEPLLAAFHLEKAEPEVKPVQPAVRPGLKTRSFGAKSARVAAIILALLALAAALLVALDWQGRQNFAWDFILSPSQDSAAEIVDDVSAALGNPAGPPIRRRRRHCRFWRGRSRFAAGIRRFWRGRSRFAAGIRRFWRGRSRFAAGIRRFWRGRSRFAAGACRFWRGRSRFAAGIRRFWRGRSRFAAGACRFWRGRSRFAAGACRFWRGRSRFATGICCCR